MNLLLLFLKVIVAPLVGAWIEIIGTIDDVEMYDVAPLVGAWIEIFFVDWNIVKDKVAPLVGAWIEIVPDLGEAKFATGRSSCRSVD